MNMKYIRLWFKSKKGYEKLFLFLIFVRPIVEPFYYFKENSLLFSPLYWIGFLTFIICIVGIFSNAKYRSPLDEHFWWWSMLVILNIAFLYFSNEPITFINYALKLIYPVTIFYFLRGFVKSKSDLYALLFVFISSGIIATLWMFYDISSSGLNLREKSSFADVVNYGIYFNILLLAILYFYLKSRFYKKVVLKPTFTIVIILIAIGLLTHLSIKHLSSVAVSLLICSIFIYYTSKKSMGNFVIGIGIAVTVLFSIGDKFYENVMEDRMKREVQVLEGKRNKSQALHGRMSRWEWLTNDFSKSSTIAIFFGYPLDMKYANHMIGVTPHNDFLRITFFTGFLGLATFLWFLLMVFRRIKHLMVSERFLCYTSLLVFILYAISTVPTFYPGFNNFIFTVFAFVSLPLKKTNEYES
jgi:hypothetical protein